MDKIKLTNIPSPTISHIGYKVFTENELHVSRVINEYVFIFMTKGTLYFSENGVEIAVSAGECYLQCKNLYQSASVASSGAEYYFLHFYADEALEDCPCTIVPKRFFYDAKVFLNKMSRLNTLARKLPFSFLGTQILFLEILNQIADNTDYDTVAVNATIDYIHAHYLEKINYADLCKKFMYSEAHLKRIFKKATGVSAHTYLLTIRLDRVVMLMQTTNYTIENIATQCGFADFSSFYRAFKARYLLSPSEYKKQNINQS